ncbi:hypothetical protein BDFB_007595, partial [Asbolus verrucosus]
LFRKFDCCKISRYLQQFFEEFHDEEIVDGCFQQGGAAAHTTLETLNTIQEFFDERVINQNAAIPYPSKSCDFTPCDFFLCNYL